MNCSKKPENLVFAEHKLHIKEFPQAILFYTNKNIVKNVSIPISSGINDALKTISDLIIDQSMLVESEDSLELQLTKSFNEEKIAVVLFHESQTISISFRTFGYLSKYKSYFNFINYKNASENVKNKYGVKKTPKIIAVIPQNFISSEGGTLVISFDGVFIYHELAKFLHHVIFFY